MQFWVLHSCSELYSPTTCCDMASASCKYLLLQSWFFMVPPLRRAWGEGLCQCILHSLFALNVEFCPFVGVHSINHRKSPSPEFEHLVSKRHLQVNSPVLGPRRQRRLQCTAVADAPTALGTGGQSGCTALAGLHAMDWQSWHLHLVRGWKHLIIVLISLLGILTW